MRSHIVPIQPELILAFENEKEKFTLFTFELSGPVRFLYSTLQYKTMLF